MPPQYSSRVEHRTPLIANKIRAYRLKLRLTQAEVARLVGVRANTISGWERGVSCPSMQLALRLAKGLDTLVEALYPQFYLRDSEDEADADAV